MSSSKEEKKDSNNTIEEEELLSDESDDEEEEVDGNLSAVGRFKQSVRRQKKAVMKMFIDYGPPYTKSETGITLLDECAQPEISLYEIHSILNNRVTPNYRDPEDFYNSAMHWCCRHVHLSAMKLLRRAKARIDLVNEFGQTPLHVLCMMKFPAFKEKLHIKTFLWLLHQGSDIDAIDKGGYCPIDYAAMNGNEFMVQTLLSRGCSVIRKHDYLAAPRESLQSLSAYRCYELITSKINDIESENAKVAAIQAREQQILEEKMKIERRRVRQEKRRKEDRENKILARSQAQQKYLEEQRDIQLKQEAEMLKRVRDMDAKRFGDWNRDMGGRWNYKSTDGSAKKFDKDAAFGAARSLMIKLRDENNFESCNQRWRNATGNNLEIKWTKENIFSIPGLSPVSNNLKESKELATEVIDSLSFRDENDAELVGENLSDLLYNGR
jgi:hypothetical protein